MQNLDTAKAADLLNQIMEHELAGVVRYTHYALMITGPYRLTVVDFLKAQATESLLHAQEAGELIATLDGHPSMKIAPLTESNQHSLQAILQESHDHEQSAIDLYKKLLDLIQDSSVYLEDYARTKIGQEERHLFELKQMLRDYQ